MHLPSPDSRLPETGTMSGSAAATVDTTAPALVGRPRERQPVDGQLVYTFSEAITLAPGASLSLTVEGQPPVAIALVGNPAVTLSGSTITIQAPQRLAYATYYDVLFSAGAISDMAGNPAFGGEPFFHTFFSELSPVALKLTGTPGSDDLRGSDLADTIDGAGAGDTILGYGGDDLLYGGSDADPAAPGADQLYGGDGDDGLWGGDGNDVLDGNNGNDRLYGEGGDDRLQGSDGDDLLDGGNGSDVLSGGAGANTLRGGEGNDRLSSSVASAVDLLDGGSGDDALEGYAGSSFLGGAGDDRIKVEGRLGTGGITRVDGGDGRDRITLSLSATLAADMEVSGGAGVDTYLPSAGSRTIASRVGIMDFTPGPGGDLIDIISLTTGSAARNPFDDGSLRLSASGADTLFQVRETSGTYSTVLTLIGVAPAQVVRENFVDAYNPLGGTMGYTLTGTAGGDKLTGGIFDDTLLGLAGNDSLGGGLGNDLIEGGDGDDILGGGGGDDTLRGGEGNDTLSAAYSGTDLLEGGAGNDRLTSDGGGNDRLLGGAGDDILTLGQVSTVATRYSVTMSGDAGNDTLVIQGTSRPVDVVASGGEGADVFEIGYSAQGAAITILDFGAQDVLDLRAWLPNGFKGNPAEAGYLRAVQQGADVAIHLDRDGLAGPEPAWTVTLAKVSLASLSSASFMGIFDPSGGSAGQSLSGTPGADVLLGGALDDTIDGGDGADRIEGGAGNDLLFAGDGNDRLDGGAGNDALNGEGGDDELLGGAGDDTMEDRVGNNILRGGDGKDQIHTGGSGSAQVFGEADDDLLFIAGGGLFDGGEGNDGFSVSLDRAATATLQLTGGAGRDSYTFSTAAPGATVVITDFAAGAGGDLIDIDKLVATPSGNPFAAGGSLQFVQRGADTVLQVRVARDGADSFQDVFVLAGVQKTALHSDNIVLDFDPQGGSYGLSTAGGGDADQLVGTVHEDSLRGGAGNDLLTGGGGYDVLDGGTGIDTAVFSGTRSQYALERVAQDAQDMVVSDLRPGINEGKDRLLGIERLSFADGALALDTGPEEIAGQAYRIYRAAFDRPADEGGLGFWIAMMDRGSTLTEIAGGFVRSQEFIDQYGAAPTNAELVTKLYRNILDRDPEPAGYAFWLDALDRKLVDLPSLLAQFSESNENRVAVAELIANGVSYQPYGG